MNHAAPSRPTGSPDDAAVALKGASLAFQRNPATRSASSSASPPELSQPGDRGSLAVDRSRSPKTDTTTNTSHAARDHHGHAHDAKPPGSQVSVVAARPRQLNGSSPFQPSAPAQRFDPKSPSFIAATLAASRSASPSPHGQPPRRKNSVGAANALAIAGSNDAVDSESIPPTENLISLFEHGREAEPARRRSPPSSSPPEREDPVREEKRAHEKGASSVMSVKPKPKPKPNLASPRPPTPPLAVVTKAERSHPVSSSKPPTPPLRSSEKISAMPMPKPQLPPQLSSPAPQTNHNPTKARHSPTNGKSHRSGVSPSPSRAEKLAVAKSLKVRPPSPPSVVKISTPEVWSPKPLRVTKPTLAPPVLSSPPQNISPDRSSLVLYSPLSPDPEKRSPGMSLRPPTPPKPRGTQRIVTSQPTSRSRHRETPDTPVLQSKPITPRTEFGLPIVSPAPPPPPPATRTVHRKKTPPPLPGRRETVASAPTSPVLGPQFTRRRLTNTSTSNLPLDTLTNAMMASSLASTRLTPHNTGSSLPAPSMPKRQKSPRLLQTLRQPQSHEDEDPERLKIAHRHKLSSNKHAHHEGARKRWRDQITQRERKRYEALWASNRGYLIHEDDGPADSLTNGLNRIKSECVSNVVVRDIWKRSRLPQDELMEVWELVDRGHVGMLTRQEFIVGMWLIDQRLKGRKLPVRVSDSVWDSANGVRVLQPRGK